MNQIFATRMKHTEHRRNRFDFRNSTAAPPREQHREFKMLRPPIISRFCPDWFPLRIWEDDGGGQVG